MLRFVYRELRNLSGAYWTKKSGIIHAAFRCYGVLAGFNPMQARSAVGGWFRTA